MWGKGKSPYTIIWSISTDGFVSEGEVSQKERHDKLNFSKDSKFLIHSVVHIPRIVSWEALLPDFRQTTDRRSGGLGGGRKKKVKPKSFEFC